MYLEIYGKNALTSAYGDLVKDLVSQRRLGPRADPSHLLPTLGRAHLSMTLRTCAISAFAYRIIGLPFPLVHTTNRFASVDGIALGRLSIPSMSDDSRLR
jgi:hypothetical protein